MPKSIRNIAIIAHVDHGKTTLVDQLLQQSGTLPKRQESIDRIMDQNDLERERGITILAKNTAIRHRDTHINIVDTPGHADFGGEVERVLSMVDGVLLLVDAVEGPMPQTRFVTQKALALGLKPIVVINKVDRNGAMVEQAIDATFDLFDQLGASDEQLDFSIIFASGLQGWAISSLEDKPDQGMLPLLELILSAVPSPPQEESASLQMQISTLDYSSYIGQIGIGRIHRGSLKLGQTVTVIGEGDRKRPAKINQIFGFHGLERIEVETASAGNIVAVSGIDNITIGDTLACPENPEALPRLSVEHPTMSMQFLVNSSPLAGTEGKFLTSRQIRDRLNKETLTNVALQVEETANSDVFNVCGRGELHLSILLENMRREGYELAVGRPTVVNRMIDEVLHEPYEALTVDFEEAYQGAVMEALGVRRAEVVDMAVHDGRTRIQYRIASRNLIGFRGEFINLTRGTGLISHIFDCYQPISDTTLPSRRNGALISQENGETVAYALWKLQERGRLMVRSNEKVYEGMVIGIHSRDNDLVVNPIKTKQLTNVRASGKDDAIMLTPVLPLSIEAAIEFIDDDELVEITPKTIRIRKRYLKEHERRRAGRN